MCQGGQRSDVSTDSSNSEESVDLNTFVDNLRHLEKILSPANIFFSWFMNCYRWKHPHANVFILLFFNGLWFQSPTAFAVFSFILIYGLLVVMSFRTDMIKRSFSKANPALKRDSKETYSEFYRSILLFNSAALYLTSFVKSTLEIVKWENPAKSLMAHLKLFYYGTVLYASCAYSSVVLLDAFLLHNLPAHLEPVFKNYIPVGQITTNVIEPVIDSEKEEKEDFHNTADEELNQPLSLSGENASSVEQAGPQPSDYYCRGCDSSFGYILNRRHYCRHCGDHFCANCCSRFVPRYFFGATAPAAKTETVMVCLRCFEYLSDKFEPEPEEETSVTRTVPSIN